MTLEELKRIAESVGERQGWDFSRVQYDRDPVPWDYADVVRRYLLPMHRVLDIGTGGGEQFLALTPYIDTGVGIDVAPGMIQVARQNTPPSLAEKISFETMNGEALGFPDASFDLVLNRHAPIYVQEITRILRPEGYFITQQVGARNTHNICAAFGCGPGGEYESDPAQEIAALSEVFRQNECAVVCRAEYDVRYWFLGVESFVFWLKALPLPQDFAVEMHWQQVDQIITVYRTPQGIQTNEHRELLIVKRYP